MVLTAVSCGTPSRECLPLLAAPSPSGRGTHRCMCRERHRRLSCSRSTWRTSSHSCGSSGCCNMQQPTRGKRAQLCRCQHSWMQPMMQLSHWTTPTSRRRLPLPHRKRWGCQFCRASSPRGPASQWAICQMTTWCCAAVLAVVWLPPVLSGRRGRGRARPSTPTALRPSWTCSYCRPTRSRPICWSG